MTDDSLTQPVAPKRSRRTLFVDFLNEGHPPAWCRALLPGELGFEPGMYGGRTVGSNDKALVVCRECHRLTWRRIDRIIEYGCRYCKRSRLHPPLLSFLQSDESKIYRAITEAEGLTADTYDGVLRDDNTNVLVACKQCSYVQTKNARVITSSGCISEQCRVKKRKNVRLARRRDVVASNTHNCRLVKGEAVEQLVAEMTRKLVRHVAGVAVLGGFNGTFDVAVLRSCDNSFRGVQVKLARAKGKGNGYRFDNFPLRYQDNLPLVVKLGQTGRWLVARCGTLRSLSKLKSEEYYYFNINTGLHKYLVCGSADVAHRLVLLLSTAPVLTRSVVLHDLSDKFALEQYSYEAARAVLRTVGENLRRSGTNSNGTDALCRRLRLQLKASSISGSWGKDILHVALCSHAGSHAGTAEPQSYHENDFDWLVVVGVKRYVKGTRTFESRHIWWIPMQRLREMRCVRTDDCIGKMTIGVAAPGHAGRAIGERKHLAFPYFEDCCDNPLPLLAELRSGVYGEVESSVEGYTALDRLMELEP